MTDFRPTTIHNIELGIGQCLALPGYSLGIALSTERRCSQYFDEIMNLIPDKNLISRKVRYRIVFTNGSVIDCFCARENTRAKRFHELIIDADIDQAIVWNCLAYQFAPPYHRWEHETYLKRIIERINNDPIHN